MKIRYTAAAVAEIADVHSYLLVRNPAAAAAVLLQVEHAVRLIGRHPEIGPVKYLGSVRMLPLRRYPQYLLFYTIEGGEVIVLNLRHAARRPPWPDDSA